jgi:16S rRNA (adenine1518-N6/adenine1519-N6)-dimethyltransferase
MNNLPSGHKARKRFGQNFLIDQGVINHIVRSIGPRPTDNLIEIGPGQGAITEQLLEACPQLHVVELDRDLIPVLLAQFAKYPGFKIHQADALQFDFAQLASPERPLRVVGNLPYNISTPLIFRLLGYHGLIEDMHFMLQKEVVERMAAQSGEKNYGRLSIMTQYYCEVEKLFEVGPESFHPMPKVDSAIVRLTPYKELPLVADDIAMFEKLVRVVFQQRRKTLRNTLKQMLPASTIESLDVDLSRRPETLSLEEYVGLSNRLSAMEKS